MAPRRARRLQAASSLDGIIDTVSEEHDVNAYMQLLDVGGKYVVLGLPPKAVPLNLAAVTMRQLQVRS